MKEVVLKENFAFLYLSKELYKKDLLKKATKEYEDHFTSSLKEIGKYHVVRIERKSKEFSIEKLSREFLNYLIFVEYDK